MKYPDVVLNMDTLEEITRALDAHRVPWHDHVSRSSDGTRTLQGLCVDNGGDWHDEWVLVEPGQNVKERCEEEA